METDEQKMQAMVSALRTAESDEQRVWIVANALGWSVDTDNEGQYILYSGVTDPEWEGDDEDDGD